MHRSPINQTKAQSIEFIKEMLQHVKELEFAAAAYGCDGKVKKVIETKVKVKSVEDYNIIGSWLWHQNQQNSNIWTRPADAEHCVIMLDDLDLETALKIANQTRTIIVETSKGNHQAWLFCNRTMTREERQTVARALSRLFGSDPGAISEPRWGRLPGFKQKKPGKDGWTNLVTISKEKPNFDASPHLSTETQTPRNQPTQGRHKNTQHRENRTRDESRAEFLFALESLRRGIPREIVKQRIEDNVARTGRRKNKDYAETTIRKAEQILEQEQRIKDTTRRPPEGERQE